MFANVVGSFPIFGLSTHYSLKQLNDLDELMQCLKIIQNEKSQISILIKAF